MPKPPRLFLFVGERRSPTAIHLGVQWHDGRLAAKPLFTALSALGVCPHAQLFLNLFPDDGPQTALPDALIQIREAHKEGLTVVALGTRVARRLSAEGIPHVSLVHPAARGAIRKRERYLAHVRERLGPLILKGVTMTDLSDRERATVLAALRWWQARRPYTGPVPADLAGHFAGLTPLSNEEIDALCERLNPKEEP